MPALGEDPVLLTGATGFLGQAVLERLLADHPQTPVVLVLRGHGSPVAERLDQLLDKPVFGAWRKRAGGDEEAKRSARERVTLIDADLSRDVPDLPPDIGTVIHCASIVSFDPPVDAAFHTNLQGTINLYEAVERSGARPHIVHVSTAYVAGSHKGTIPEASLDHTVDWRAEMDAALAARSRVELDSRNPGLLGKLRRDAQREHRKAGPQAVATATERRRTEIVEERLVEHGSARAASLGWPDVYTLTKALGERATEEKTAGLPLSVVRPAIVESALHHPFPGWIDGFKMAEPLILAYGRGILADFPGVPDGVIDIVPVDIVTNALLAVAANPPGPDEPAYYHVGSGARNPLSFRGLYEQVKAYFEKHPFDDPDGRGSVRPPAWSFPGSARLDRMLRTAERAVGTAEKTLLALPAGERTRDWQGSVSRQQRKFDFLRRYADLYGAYTEAEVIYTDDRTLALHRALPPDEQRTAGFDSAEIDWPHYLQQVHCPAVTAPMRMSRPQRATPIVKIPEAGDVAAVFDLEGTVLASNVIEAYLWLRLMDAPRSAWAGELASVARSLPRYLRADHRDRGEFLRTFLRRYEGASEAELRRLVDERLADLLLRRAWPQAVRRVRRHRAAGHRTVLVTGAIDLLVEPLHGLFDEVVASKLHVEGGRCTGYLDRPPMTGEARAAWLRSWAGEQGYDLSRSFAYADHYSDRPFLETVGNPVAVNPDARLYRHAKQHRWVIEEWKSNILGPVGALAEVAGQAGQAGQSHAEAP